MLKLAYRQLLPATLLTLTATTVAVSAPLAASAAPTPEPTRTTLSAQSQASVESQTSAEQRQGVREFTEAQLAELRAEQEKGGGTLGGGNDDPTTKAPEGRKSPSAADYQTVPGTPGVDVSKWDPDVNWPYIASKGFKFSYAKATEGTTYRSPLWSEQYRGAAKVGMLTGSYHFALPPTSTGAQQARFFVANGGHWKGDGKTLPPLLDMEFNKYSSLGGMCYDMTPAQLSAWVDDFVRTTVALTGRQPAIYTNKYWWETCVKSTNFGSNPLFIARYSTAAEPAVPAGWSKWTMWQYTETGSVLPDQDTFNGSYAELVKWAANDASIGPVGPSATPLLGSFTGQVATSPNGRFRLVMQSDGNLVTYDATGKPIWSSRTTTPGLRLAAQSDGNLVMYDGTGPRWHTATSGATSIALQDDGNLVIRNAAGNAIWDSFRLAGRNSVAIQTRVRSLASGQTTWSIQGGHRLVMQTDGNLVLLRPNGTAAWSSRTQGNRGARFAMQSDGNAVVYSAAGRPIWNSRTQRNPGAGMVLQSDGNLVIYAGKAIWSAR